MINKSLQINRLRILSRGIAVYDERFHEGVNIIRGQNGSGKSTIADCIFFILGGEFDDWKDAAKRCDEVQAEIETPNGPLTLRRATVSKQEPISTFFGVMDKADEHSLEGWQRFPIRRQNNSESFSQVLFRSLNIPEAKSDGASNITMHQLLRLMYSDQRTPASRIFRYEPFDTQNIREAVGDLVCGISGYEIYEANINLRELEKELSVINTSLFGLLKALPSDESLRTSASIYSSIKELNEEIEILEKEIRSVDENDNLEDVNTYLKQRKSNQVKLSKQRLALEKNESDIQKIKLEKLEIDDFQSYLSDLIVKLNLAEASLDMFGSIDFTHCPSCGSEVKIIHDECKCSLCKSEKKPEEELSRYNQIRLDLEIQMRESKQLFNQTDLELKEAKAKYNLLSNAYRGALSEFEMKYSSANGPREAYLAERTSRIGHINAELDFLTKSLGVASEVDSLTAKKNSVLNKITDLEALLSKFYKRSEQRRSKSYLEISKLAVSLLHADFKRQEEFEAAQRVDINFINDAISVDGVYNFAESSNVFLKNSSIFSIFLAAGMDPKFNHPKFLLLDNIEDKGMEVERSHLFQKLIVERATELEVPFQIIFTTSMMNEDLELDDYIIGPSYTRENKTLNFMDQKK